jgi:3-deoxy-D-manno-octulosonate 8-phosphate phosphatase (KDO 8-P phosphatase)
MSQERARKIKLMVFDVDGVMTDGTIFVFPLADAEMGDIPAETHAGLPSSDRSVTHTAGTGVTNAHATEPKGFNAHDGIGISLARLGGLKTAIITKRISQSVALRARDLRIDHVYQGQDNKTQAFYEILNREGLTPEEACYVGDDIIDLPVMRLCGLAVAVKNARPKVLREAHFVTEHEGGHGGVRDAIEYVLEQQGKLEQILEEYVTSRGTAAPQRATKR